MATVWLLLVASCSSRATSGTGVAAIDRTVSIVTTACGFASHTTGTGVVIDDGLVLTAAHVVVGSTEITVEPGGRPAVLTAIDLQRDLAVLSVPTEPLGEVRLVHLSDGDPATVVGGSASGSVEVVVEQKATIVMDDVRGTQRHRRGGYVLSGRIAGGDSGAGLFTGDELAGIVFAVRSDGSRLTYAVDSTEISDFLSSRSDGAFECDPEQSRVVAVP